MNSVAGWVDPSAFDAVRNESHAAYERVADEMHALRDDELIAANVDVMTGVSTVLAGMVALRRFRKELIAKLPTFDIASFDKLETYARAALHAQALHSTGSATPDVWGLVEAASSLREALLSDATVLARRGLLDAQKLAALKGPSGYRNLAFDLSALSRLLRDAWPRLDGRTAITPAELNEARLYADRLLIVAGSSDRSALPASRAALARQRAFTLFARAYDQVRRAFTYLRWDEGDVDEFVPAFDERRNPRRRNPSATTSETALSVVPRPPLRAASARAATGYSMSSSDAFGLPAMPFEDPFELEAS